MTLLTLSSPLHTYDPFFLPLLVCQWHLYSSPQKANKRKKKIHYRSGLRSSFHVFSPVQPCRLLRILMWNGGTVLRSHVLSTLNREWGRKWICEDHRHTEGMKKRGKVPECMREQTVLVLFLYQSFVLFKRGVLLKRDFQYFLKLSLWNWNRLVAPLAHTLYHRIRNEHKTTHLYFFPSIPQTCIIRNLPSICLAKNCIWFLTHCSCCLLSFSA